MKKFPYILYIPIADIICELHIQNKDHKKYYEKQYILLKSPPEKYDSIKIYLIESSEYYTFLSSPKKIKFRIKKKNLASFNDIVVLVRLLIDYHLAYKGVLIFHGSALIKGGQGYAFCAPSGTGKSTIVSRLPKRMVLSDDLFVVKKIKNRFYIFTSPFDKVHVPKLVFQNVLLDTIFFLRQSSFNKIEEESLGENINSLFINNLLLGWNRIQFYKKRNIDKSIDRKVTSLAFDLVKLCKLRKLYFTKDVSILELLN